jgi:predicted Zn-dependent protease
VRARAARLAVLLGGLALAAVGCRTSDIAGNLAGGFVGGRTGDVARAAVGGFIDSREIVEQMNTKFSPEQEYYLGRAVAANAIARYGLDPDEKRQDYVRLVGAAIVALSERLPATYGGYHFAVLDTDIANGISGPGGFVLVTRGAVERCRNEEELAGILAHELAHVSLRHGEQILRQGGEWQASFSTFARVAAAAAGAGETSFRNDMAKLFGDAVGDLSKKIAQDGYGRAAELEADREGTLILYDTGYDAAAIEEYMKAGPDRSQQTWETHPGADVRIAALEPVVKVYGGPFDGGVGREARTRRFHAILGGS